MLWARERRAVAGRPKSRVEEGHRMFRESIGILLERAAIVIGAWTESEPRVRRVFAAASAVGSNDLASDATDLVGRDEDNGVRNLLGRGSSLREAGSGERLHGIDANAERGRLDG